MPQETTVPQRDVNVFNNDGPTFSKPRTEPLEVIIVGLPRTGTTSMLEAMSILGYGNIYNSREMVRKHQVPFCGALIRAKLTGQGPPASLEQFESVFGDFRCISGEFVAVMAEEIIAAYPEAKVILTVRSDEERWLQSINDSLWYNYSSWSHWFLRNVDRQWREQNAFLDPFWNGLFWGDVQGHGLRVYREHNAKVKRVVEEGRLLVYDVEEGWEPLTRFLGKEVPGVGFPKTNTVAEHRRLFGGGRARSLRSWVIRNVLGVGLPVTVVGLVLAKRGRVFDLLRDVFRA